MRLDKFLKVSRLIKRRSVANDACDTDHVLLNGKPAKPGAKLKVGDVITLRFGERLTDVEVLSLNEHAFKQDAQNMYRVIRQD
ncbi:MAG: RNA-binding S4 domain-containing protein [Clostridia bacterium]|nr:RNA-binding S4 domain-containing protein [Clostridia bacterium]MCR4577726.1 RNA-binding S4 domain-containing protein [Clostridiales bacterium]